MSNRVSLIDYGVGNLLSVSRALEKCGAEVELIDNRVGVERAEKLLLPGVGAFANGMDGLRARGLVEPLRAFARSGRPFLGICLGMQLLMERSEEFGDHEGLGVIPGRVRAVEATTAGGSPHKIPHIGWNQLVRPEGVHGWAETILSDLQDRAYAYFVHSFTAEPAAPGHRLADCYYDGRQISAVVRSENIFGCQFHPEKSGEVGLRVIRRFVESQ